MKTYDLAVVGGGIVGLFAAYHALIQGHSVVLFEADASCTGASVRNFGQIIPSGLELTRWRHVGIRSLEIYRDLMQRGALPIRLDGSTYVAGVDQEQSLLEELAALDQSTSYASNLLTRQQAMALHPGLKGDAALAALQFPQEMTADSRQLVGSLLKMLESFADFRFLQNCVVYDVRSGPDGISLGISAGLNCRARQALICCGHKHHPLFQEYLKRGPHLTQVRLQMMETYPLPAPAVRGNFLSGLSIRRYPAFHSCPSYGGLTETPNTRELLEHGIHVLCNARPDGALVLGDSHHYYAEDEPVDFGIDESVSQLILNEARRLLKLDGAAIARQWNGYYCQTEDGDALLRTVTEGIHFVTGLGGKGMTVAPGLMERIVPLVMSGKPLSDLNLSICEQGE